MNDFSKKILSVLLTIAFLGLVGCASRIPKGEAFPEMYDENPVSVLVIPAINNSTAADAPELYASTISEPLANSGFYVLPVSVTDRFLQNEGFSDGAQLLDVPAEKFQSLFGADAVLYVTIEKWDTSYYVIGGNVTVEIDFKLKSTKSGALLWSYKGVQVLDTSGDSGAGLLGAIIATAIQTSLQDYVPVARNVNVAALRAIPYGKYHKAHGKDVNQMIPKGKTGNDEP